MCYVLAYPIKYQRVNQQEYLNTSNVNSSRESHVVLLSALKFTRYQTLLLVNWDENVIKETAAQDWFVFATVFSSIFQRAAKLDDLQMCYYWR